MSVHCKLFGMLCVCALLLAGCGHRDSTPTPTPNQRQRVTYLANRLHPGFSLELPRGWAYKVTDSGLIVSNTSGALNAAGDGGEMPAGSLVADMSLLTPAELAGMGAKDASGILMTIVGAGNANADAVYAAIDWLHIPDRDSAQLLARPGSNETLLVAEALDDHYLLAVIVAPQGEMQNHAAALIDAFASAQLLTAQ